MGTVGRQKKPFSNNIFPTSIKRYFMPVYTNAFPRASRYLYNIHVVVTKHLKAAPEPIH